MFAIAKPEAGSLLRVNIYIEQKHVDRAYARLFEDLINRGNIPGFRKGKVPIWRIRREYGRKAIDGAVYGELMEQALRCVLTYGDLSLIAQPDFQNEEDERLAEEGKPLTSDALVLPVKSEVRIPSLKNVEFKTPEIEPTPEEVDEEIRALQEAATELVDVERTDVQPGDQVEIKMRAQVEGESEPEEREETLIVGEGRYDPALDEPLIGHKVGETVQFTVDYPDNPSMEDLAGKRVQITAEIKATRARKVPPLDDEFAAKAMEGCSSVEALREEVKQQIRRRREAMAKAVLREQVVRWLEENVRVDIPQGLVNALTQGEMKDREDSLKSLRTTLACEEILAQHGVEVTEAEMRQAYIAFGARAGVEPSVLAKDVLDRRTSSVFRGALVLEKAADLIAQAATKKVVPLSELTEIMERAESETDRGADERTEGKEDA